ncbi:Cytochrome P450 E-class group I [Penicillium verrucosum]|uniref:Cytochrome P450 E-class group I n=1 Tax=Penicillium verrucosum TaxID=60171 RepID=UPI002544DACB|nr:Cytochrome P450 E-class group I [Penicillium verrucosum]KAJ5922478.1 Cytochrome P450 E-class group I [Penicillium verrucosum]
MTDLFHHNLASPQLKTQASFLRMLMDSKAEKNNIVLSIPEVFGELMGIMQGAVIDISNVLPYCAFRIARDPEVQRKLLVELQTVWKNPDEPIPPCEVLGNLPYLKGVVKESLRLTHGVISGMPRVVTVEGTQIDGNLIPSGTVVVTSSSYVHMDSTIFPDPERFIPERWHAEDPQLDRSLASFSKGRRMCPGAHISYPHLSTATAAVFRKFEVSLYETTDEDMKYKTYVSIHFTGRPLRVTLKPRPS